MPTILIPEWLPRKRALSLCNDFPQALGIACVLLSYTFTLILSDPAHAVLGR